jgi:nicotinamidase-related amidase
VRKRGKRREPSVLVVVDLQAAFAPPKRLVNRIRRYARRFDRRVFTQFVNPPRSMFRRQLKQGCCGPGSGDTTLLIAPEKGDLVLKKTTYGIKPADARRIRSLGAETVTLCGMDTDACVLGVAFSLFDAGIAPRPKESLCWSSSGLQREAVRILRTQFPGTR